MFEYYCFFDVGLTQCVESSFQSPVGSPWSSAILQDEYWLENKIKRSSQISKRVSAKSSFLKTVFIASQIPAFVYFHFHSSSQFKSCKASWPIMSSVKSVRSCVWGWMARFCCTFPTSLVARNTTELCFLFLFSWRLPFLPKWEFHSNKLRHCQSMDLESFWGHLCDPRTSLQSRLFESGDFASSRL